MLTIIQEHLEEIVAVLLFAIGFTTLLLQRNLIKKIIGFNIMDTAIYLLLTSVGYIEGRTAPILTDGHHLRPVLHQPHPRGPGADGHRGQRERDGADALAHRAPLPPLPHAGYRPHHAYDEGRGRLICNLYRMSPSSPSCCAWCRAFSAPCCRAAWPSG